MSQTEASADEIDFRLRHAMGGKRTARRSRRSSLPIVAFVIVLLLISRIRTKKMGATPNKSIRRGWTDVDVEWPTIRRE